MNSVLMMNDFCQSPAIVLVHCGHKCKNFVADCASSNTFFTAGLIFRKFLFCLLKPVQPYSFQKCRTVIKKPMLFTENDI